MRSKFFTSASSALLLVLPFLICTGQSTTPAPKLGYIRFWNMLPQSSGSLELRKMNVPPSEATLFTGAPHQYLSYVDLPATRYQLGVFQKNSNSAPVKLLAVDLKPDTYFTVLASTRGNQIEVEVFDDTNDPKATTGTLTVRNYFSGLAVDVLVNSKDITGPVAYNESRGATGLPLGRVPIGLRFKLPNGSTADSGAELDLRQAKRATLLIVPDYRGRFTPLVTVDGKNL